MGVHQAGKKWTDEETAELLRLRFVEKWTDNRLAKHFDTTRNVIAGKLSRERIKAGYTPMKRGPLGRTRALPGTAEKKPSLAPLPARRAVIPREPPIDFGMITEGTGEPCTLVNLVGCKWPIGEVPGHRGRHIFCNAPRPNDARQPYCAEHAHAAVENHKPWTPEDDAKVKAEWRGGTGRDRLSQILHRTKASISNRARSLGIAVV